MRRPALALDVPVAVVLVTCWLLVSIAWAHVVTGLVLIGWVVAHLLTRRTRLVRTGSVTRARLRSHRRAALMPTSGAPRAG